MSSRAGIRATCFPSWNASRILCLRSSFLLSWAKIVFSFLMVSGIEEGVRWGQLDLSLRGIGPDPMPVQLLSNQGAALSAP